MTKNCHLTGIQIKHYCQPPTSAHLQNNFSYKFIKKPKIAKLITINYTANNLIGLNSSITQPSTNRILARAANGPARSNRINTRNKEKEAEEIKKKSRQASIK